MDWHPTKFLTLAAEKGTSNQNEGYLVKCRLDGSGLKHLLKQWRRGLQVWTMGDPPDEGLDVDPIEVEATTLARFTPGGIDQTRGIDAGKVLTLKEEMSAEHPYRTNCTWRPALTELGPSPASRPNLEAEIVPFRLPLHHSLDITWPTEPGLRKELQAPFGLSLVTWKEVLGSRYEDVFGEVDHTLPELGARDQQAGLELHSRMLMSIARNYSSQADPEATARTMNLR